MSIPPTSYGSVTRKRKVFFSPNFFLFFILIDLILLAYLDCRLEKELFRRERDKVDLLTEHQLTLQKKDKLIAMLTKRARELEKRSFGGAQNESVFIISLFFFFVNFFLVTLFFIFILFFYFL